MDAIVLIFECENVFTFKYLSMKKMIKFILIFSFVIIVTPTLLRAESLSDQNLVTEHQTVQFAEETRKTIDLSVPNSSANNELSKAPGVVPNDQNGRSRRYQDRRARREIDITIRSNHQEPNDRIHRNHSNGGAYLGGGGVLLLILILILVL